MQNLDQDHTNYPSSAETNSATPALASAAAGIFGLPLALGFPEVPSYVTYFGYGLLAIGVVVSLYYLYKTRSDRKATATILGADGVGIGLGVGITVLLDGTLGPSVLIAALPVMGVALVGAAVAAYFYYAKRKAAKDSVAVATLSGPSPNNSTESSQTPSNSASAGAREGMPGDVRVVSADNFGPGLLPSVQNQVTTTSELSTSTKTSVLSRRRLRQQEKALTAGDSKPQTPQELRAENAQRAREKLGDDVPSPVFNQPPKPDLDNNRSTVIGNDGTSPPSSSPSIQNSSNKLTPQGLEPPVQGQGGQENTREKKEAPPMLQQSMQPTPEQLKQSREKLNALEPMEVGKSTKKSRGAKTEVAKYGKNSSQPTSDRSQSSVSPISSSGPIVLPTSDSQGEVKHGPTPTTGVARPRVDTSAVSPSPVIKPAFDSKEQPAEQIKKGRYFYAYSPLRSKAIMDFDDLGVMREASSKTASEIVSLTTDLQSRKDILLAKIYDQLCQLNATKKAKDWDEVNVNFVENDFLGLGVTFPERSDPSVPDAATVSVLTGQAGVAEKLVMRAHQLDAAQREELFCVDHHLPFLHGKNFAKHILADTKAAASGQDYPMDFIKVLPPRLQAETYLALRGEADVASLPAPFKKMQAELVENTEFVAAAGKYFQAGQLLQLVQDTLGNDHKEAPKKALELLKTLTPGKYQAQAAIYLALGENCVRLQASQSNLLANFRQMQVQLLQGEEFMKSMAQHFTDVQKITFAEEVLSASGIQSDKTLKALVRTLDLEDGSCIYWSLRLRAWEGDAEKNYRSLQMLLFGNDKFINSIKSDAKRDASAQDSVLNKCRDFSEDVLRPEGKTGYEALAKFFITHLTPVDQVKLYYELRGRCTGIAAENRKEMSVSLLENDGFFMAVKNDPERLSMLGTDVLASARGSASLVSRIRKNLDPIMQAEFYNQLKTAVTQEPERVKNNFKTLQVLLLKNGFGEIVEQHFLTKEAKGESTDAQQKDELTIFAQEIIEHDVDQAKIFIGALTPEKQVYICLQIQESKARPEKFSDVQLAWVGNNKFIQAAQDQFPKANGATSLPPALVVFAQDVLKKDSKVAAQLVGKLRPDVSLQVYYALRDARASESSENFQQMQKILLADDNFFGAITKNPNELLEFSADILAASESSSDLVRRIKTLPPDVQVRLYHQLKEFTINPQNQPASRADVLASSEEGSVMPSVKALPKTRVTKQNFEALQTLLLMEGDFKKIVAGHFSSEQSATFVQDIMNKDLSQTLSLIRIFAPERRVQVYLAAVNDAKGNKKEKKNLPAHFKQTQLALANDVQFIQAAEKYFPGASPAKLWTPDLISFMQDVLNKDVVEKDAVQQDSDQVVSPPALPPQAILSQAVSFQAVSSLKMMQPRLQPQMLLALRGYTLPKCENKLPALTEQCKTMQLGMIQDVSFVQNIGQDVDFGVDKLYQLIQDVELVEKYPALTGTVLSTLSAADSEKAIGLYSGLRKTAFAQPSGPSDNFKSIQKHIATDKNFTKEFTPAQLNLFVRDLIESSIEQATTFFKTLSKESQSSIYAELRQQYESSKDAPPSARFTTNFKNWQILLLTDVTLVKNMLKEFKDGAVVQDSKSEAAKLQQFGADLLASAQRQQAWGNLLSALELKGKPDLYFALRAKCLQSTTPGRREAKDVSSLPLEVTEQGQREEKSSVQTQSVTVQSNEAQNFERMRTALFYNTDFVAATGKSASFNPAAGDFQLQRLMSLADDIANLPSPSSVMHAERSKLLLASLKLQTSENRLLVYKQLKFFDHLGTSGDFARVETALLEDDAFLERLVKQPGFETFLTAERGTYLQVAKFLAKKPAEYQPQLVALYNAGSYEIQTALQKQHTAFFTSQVLLGSGLLRKKEKPAPAASGRSWFGGRMSFAGGLAAENVSKLQSSSTPASTTTPDKDTLVADSEHQATSTTTGPGTPSLSASPFLDSDK